jgi:hypothetical protein
MNSLSDIGFVLSKERKKSEQQQNNFEKLLFSIGDYYGNVLERDDDKETVARGCEGLSLLIKKFGVKYFSKSLKSILKSLTKLLEKKGNCNETYLDEEDDNEHDIILIDAVSDTIDDIARGMGHTFEPFFKKLFPILLKYLKDEKSNDDKVMALGTISEVLNSIQQTGLYEQYSKKTIPLILKYISNSNQNLKRNSIFCSGYLKN